MFSLPSLAIAGLKSTTEKLERHKLGKNSILGNSLAVELPALDRATVVRIHVSQPAEIEYFLVFICDPL